MGFLIAFIVVSAICVVLEARRHQGYWTGTPRDGYLHRAVSVFGRRRVEIGVPARGAASFVIRPETRFDGLAKQAEIASEMQVGDADFDRAAYVVSDDPAVRGMLAADPTLTRSILELMEPDDALAFRFHELVCRAGTLRAIFVPARRGAGADPLLDWAGPLVRRIGGAIPPLPEHRLHDPSFLRSIALLGVSSALAVNGVIQLGQLAAEPLPLTLDVVRLWLQSAGVGALIVAVLVVATLTMLRRSARTHGVLLEIALIGFLGGTTTAFTELRALNASDDDGPVERVAVTVAAAHALPAWQGRARVELDVANTDGRHPHATRTLTLPAEPWADVEPGDTLELVQHTGILGVRWVADVERGRAAAADPPATPRREAIDTGVALTATDWAQCRIPGLALPVIGHVVVVDGRPLPKNGVTPPVPPLVDVDIDVPGRVALLLTAPESVHWRLNAGPATEIVGVLASGRFPHKVTGAGDDVFPLVRSTALGHACGRTWLAAGAVTLPLADVTREVFGRAHDALVRVRGTRATVARDVTP